MLREVFRLTKTEAQVAQLVGQGKSASQIASELGSAVATVRVQLKSVFSKTKTRRQSELAAVLGRASFLPCHKEVATHLVVEDVGARSKSEPEAE
jgi:DNA-binding CsgD family transcriptional regulator